MISTPLALILLLLSSSALLATRVDQTTVPPQSARIEARYDPANDRTTVRLAPVQISGANGKYYRLLFAVSYSYPGQRQRAPELLDFELLSVVKSRKLKIDLQVLLFVDGEKIFLSSSRSAIRNPVPGKRWIGERIVLHMPFKTFAGITEAKDVEIRLDAARFNVAAGQLQALRDFGTYITAN
jgi:hypothetical protein